MMTPTTTTTTDPHILPVAVQEFVRRIRSADWDGMEDHLTPTVLYDATVPEWHYQYEGAGRVVQEYREEWNGRHLWSIREQHVIATPDAVVLAIEAHGEPISGDGPAPAVVRLANMFRMDGDRIAEHRLYCCGEWDPETVRNIAEHAPKVERMGS